MAHFRKKPVVISAIRLTRPVKVETCEGTMAGNPGDWLITGIKGEQYPCKHDIFMETYEPADDEATRYLDSVHILVRSHSHGSEAP